MRKRARKDARRALYKSYSEQGKKNTKKKRRTTVGSVQKGNHTVADCGNPGCKRCNPQFAQITHGHIGSQVA